MADEKGSGRNTARTIGGAIDRLPLPHRHAAVRRATATRSWRGRARPASTTMLIVGGVDEEAGHRRALRVAEELGLPGLRRRPSARGAAGHATRLRRAARAGAREADRGHRRDRPRLPLRPLAARRAARGLPPAGPAGPRRRPARDHPHPRGRRRDRGPPGGGGGGRDRGRDPLLHRRPRAGAPRPGPRLLHLVLRASWPSRGPR